jgi:hypothetical protein
MVKPMQKETVSSASHNHHNMPSANASLTARVGLLRSIWIVFQLTMFLMLLLLLALPVTQLITRSALNLTGVISLLAGLTLAYGLRPARWKTSNKFAPDSVHGIRLANQQVPSLSALVERIARESGLRIPVKIYLCQGTQINMVTKTNWRAQTTNAYILIGLGLFGILSEAELSAIITQQISTLYQPQTTGSAHLHSLRRRARHVVNVCENSLFIVDIGLLIFAHLFLRLTAHTQAMLSLTADNMAAHRYGRTTLCNALEKIDLMRPMWQAYWQYELDAAIQRDTYLPIFEGFRRFCKASPKRAEIQTFLQAFPNEAKQQARSNFDCTPPLGERLQALRGKNEASFPALADCLYLLGGEATAEVIWYSQFETGLSNTSDWSHYARAIFPARIRAQFAQHWMNPSKFAFTELINLAYQIDDLWEKNRPANIDLLSPQAKRQASLKLLEDWIIACLLQRGFQIHLHPGQSLRMQNHEKIVTPGELLDAALAGTLKSSYVKQFDPAPNPH